MSFLLLETKMPILARMKPNGKLWTYISDMNGLKSQIDYILINKKWRKSVKNVEAYSSFSSMGSDHRILTTNVKLSLRTSKTPPKSKPFDWWAFKQDIDLQELYSVTVKNKYQVLCVELTEDEYSAGILYAQLIKANNHTADELIPLKPQAKGVRTANDPQVMAAINGVNAAFSNYQLDPTNENEQLLQNEKGKIKEAYERTMAHDLEKLVARVESADVRAQHAESWRLINQISGRKTTKKGIFKGNNSQERLQSWYNHFNNLLCKEPTVSENSINEAINTVFSEEQLDIKTGPFTIEEYKAVKKTICTGKSPGEDGITPELLKFCNLDEIVLEYASKL